MLSSWTAMGICNNIQHRLVFDMLSLLSFALLMLLLHSHVPPAVALSGRSSLDFQRRVRTSSDDKTMSSDLHELRAAEDAVDHTLQPSKISTEVSTHVDAESGEKQTDAVESLESKDDEVQPRVSRRMDLQFSTSSIDLESMHDHPVYSQMQDINRRASQTTQSDHRMHPLREGLCMYTITTETGKKYGAGTDATISLALYNQDEDRAYFPVLDNGKNNFEKGHIDTFAELAQCVPNVCKMILSTDDSGFFADWYVDTLSFSVTTSAGHQEKTWDLHQWLPSDDASASLFILKDDCSSAPAPPPAA